MSTVSNFRGPALAQGEIKNDLVFPLSLGQQRFWFLNELYPGTPAYNVPMSFELFGPVLPQVLSAAINALISRHEALRTRLDLVNGLPSQIVTEQLCIETPFHDLSFLPADHKQSEILKWRSLEAGTPFNLNQGPLIRTRLLQVAREKFLLLVTLHHAVCDGWSAGIISTDLAELYRSIRLSQASSLSELPIQYGDFSVWQQETSTENYLKQLTFYWRSQLAGNDEPLEFPSDNPRGRRQTFNGALVRHPLPLELSTAVHAFCKAHNVTTYMVGLAAFYVLLLRCTGKEQISVGCPVANRSRSETEKLIGLFANTLVIRTDLTNNPTFSELLLRVRETTLAAYAHQEMPFEKLVEILNPQREMTHNPLFQVMFATYDAPDTRIQAADIEIKTGEVHLTASKFDLTLFLISSGNSLEARLEYNTDLYHSETAQRLLGHFETLLRHAIASPGTKISLLPLLTQAEQRQLLEWNNTAKPFDTSATLHRLIEERISQSPAGIAFTFGEHQLTCLQVNLRSNKLARWLREQGVGPNTLVGVVMERSLEMCISLLAILKAGGAYVPIDPTYPADRVAYMLEDSAVGVLLTQEHLLKRLPTTTARILPLDSSWSMLEAYSGQNLSPCNTPDDLAYMIYTSGSTGRPKGALNTHAGICNRLIWMQDQYRLTSQDKILQKTPFGFDVSVWEFFWPLLAGCELVIAKPEGHKDPQYLAQLIQQHQITTIHFVPSMLGMFMEEPLAPVCRSLKRVICSGEALSLELQKRFFELFNCELHNLYGPTEAAVDVSHWRCSPNATATCVPIGKPISNIQLHILDSNLQLLPINIPGELHIGGVGVGKGYHRKPELTAEKFIPNPFGPGTLYKTGDLAKYLHDGSIQYLGRLDHQVKIRGLRIELEEISRVLEQHNSVREAVVTTDNTLQNPLIAYCVPARKELDIPQIKAFLQTHLPDYMIPNIFVPLERMPLGPNGKVDRKALPRANQLPSTFTKDRVAPRNEIEERLLAIWREVLKTESLGVEDDFFEVGGHSLLATQIVTRIRKQFKCQLPLSDFFERPTVAGLARELARPARETEPATSFIPRRRTSSLDITTLNESEIEELLKKELSK
ncbi:MAG: amino acid adenylation domain-containing protein [Verrucomicrobiota bacterium]|nr:amino acid adenylation domain-containing protein [Verrucomicrobiota bacterium]